MVLDRPGECHIEITGQDLSPLFKEAGAHRLQRIPPTERRGRVHTSTVTVAVIDAAKYRSSTVDQIDQCDLKIEWYSGTGAGGQHRNKTQNSCRLTHRPTGIVKTAQTRSRENSYNEAYSALVSELNLIGRHSAQTQLSSDRTSQMGNGSNSNVVRTYCFQHGFVKNNDGVKISVDQFNKGLLHLLW